MHELSIAQSLVNAAQEIAEKEKFKCIKSLTVEIGPLSGVVQESLEFVFPFACEGTFLQGSKLIVEEIPVQVYCFSCRKIQSVIANDLSCPECEGLDIELKAGNEICLKTMEVSENV